MIPRIITFLWQVTLFDFMSPISHLSFKILQETCDPEVLAEVLCSIPTVSEHQLLRFRRIIRRTVFIPTLVLWWGTLLFENWVTCATSREKNYHAFLSKTFAPKLDLARSFSHCFRAFCGWISMYPTRIQVQNSPRDVT